MSMNEHKNSRKLRIMKNKLEQIYITFDHVN